MANLISVDKYKDIEGLTSTKEDARLEILVPSISQLVKTYCGNSIIDFFSSDKVEEFSIDWDTHLVQLTESPLISVSQVETRDDPTKAYEVVSSSSYYVDTRTDSVFYTKGGAYRNWPKGPGAVKVTYRAGYSACPADLELAVADLITYYLKDEHKVRQTLSGATQQNPESSLRNNVAFPDHIKRVLDLYKNF